MTLPGDFRTQTKTIGPSNVKHPIYTFQVNLDRLKSESVGPNTNLRGGAVLHPDMYGNDPDGDRTRAAQHQTGNVSWIPALFPGMNIDVHDDGTITAYGSQAAYLKKTYADVANPLLTLTNSPPYTSA